MTEPESAFVEANGLRLHYLTWRPLGGEPDPPAIVLNHATGFLARLWQPVAERLAAAGYLVYAYDARGHGDSDKPDAAAENYDWRRIVDDLQGFLDALGLRDAHFVGHSMGGSTGLYLAGTRPEYLSSVVAIEPIIPPAAVPPDASGPREMAEGARRRRMVFNSAEEAFGQYRARSLFQRWPGETLRLYIDHGMLQREDGQVQVKCSGEIEAEIFTNSASLGTWNVLPQIKAPVLVLLSEYADGFLRMVATGVAQRVPNGRLETVPDAGHLSPMERPDAVAELILGFLAG